MASIAIIGGGFSGLMALRHLVAQARVPLTIDVHEAEAALLAKGRAYSTPEPDHLLNVPAAKMGAFPDKIDDFYLWLGANKPRWRALHPSFAAAADYAADAFVPRMIYADYLAAILEEAKTLATAGGHTLRFVFERVTAVDAARVVTTQSGANARYDVVLLAMGHYGVRDLLVQDHSAVLMRPWDHTDAKNFWRWFDTQNWRAESRIAVIGTGLSAVDMIQSIASRGFAGTVIALSRQGNFPAVHRLEPRGESPLPQADAFTDDADAFHDVVMRQMQAAGDGWRQVIDDLRPITNAIWQGFSTAQQETFLRRYFSWWNPLRHRMPQSSATLLESMRQSGKLRVVLGHVESCEILKDGELRVVLKDAAPVEAEALISTMGFTYRVADAQNTLVATLADSKLLRPTAFGTGLQSGVAGEVATGIYSIGPLRFGALLETLAVPELRTQSREAAMAALTYLKA